MSVDLNGINSLKFTVKIKKWKKYTFQALHLLSVKWDEKKLKP